MEMNNFFKFKEKFYPKWFIHFLCWFIPSSKNRKNLKKYIVKNKIDIYDILNDLNNKLDHISIMQNILSEKINWVIYNNISIHSHAETSLLKIPDGSQVEFNLKNINNQLCFNREIIYNKPKIYVVTLPKAGTYFMGKILEELGFSNTNIHSNELGFVDYGHHTLYDKLNLGSNFYVRIPFYLQSQLLQNGQFIVGHLPFFLQKYINDSNILLLIRDLRKCIVSFLRFLQRRDDYKNRTWFHMGVNENSVIEFLDDVEIYGFMNYCTNEIILWKNELQSNVIRYEDIVSGDEKNFSSCIHKISKLTNSEYQDVVNARLKALNSETMTYSGKPSTLANIWTEKVEEKFVSLGCDVLNEQLGYPREWNAKNYPS